MIKKLLISTALLASVAGGAMAQSANWHTSEGKEVVVQSEATGRIPAWTRAFRGCESNGNYLRTASNQPASQFGHVSDCKQTAQEFATAISTASRYTATVRDWAGAPDGQGRLGSIVAPNGNTINYTRIERRGDADVSVTRQTSLSDSRSGAGEGLNAFTPADVGQYVADSYSAAFADGTYSHYYRINSVVLPTAPGNTSSIETSHGTSFNYRLIGHQLNAAGGESSLDSVTGNGRKSRIRIFDGTLDLGIYDIWVTPYENGRDRTDITTSGNTNSAGDNYNLARINIVGAPDESYTPVDDLNAVTISGFYSTPGNPRVSRISSAYVYQNRHHYHVTGLPDAAPTGPVRDDVIYTRNDVINAAGFTYTLTYYQQVGTTDSGNPTFYSTDPVYSDTSVDANTAEGARFDVSGLAPGGPNGFLPTGLIVSNIVAPMPDPILSTFILATAEGNREVQCSAVPDGDDFMVTYTIGDRNFPDNVPQPNGCARNQAFGPLSVVYGGIIHELAAFDLAARTDSNDVVHATLADKDAAQMVIDATPVVDPADIDSGWSEAESNRVDAEPTPITVSYKGATRTYNLVQSYTVDVTRTRIITSQSDQDDATAAVLLESRNAGHNIDEVINPDFSVTWTITETLESVTRNIDVSATANQRIRAEYNRAESAFNEDLGNNVDHGVKLSGNLANGDKIVLNLTTIGAEYHRTYIITKKDNTFEVTPRVLAGIGDVKYVGAGVDIQADINEVREALAKAGVDMDRFNVKVGFDSGNFIYHTGGDKNGFDIDGGLINTDAEVYGSVTTVHEGYTINAKVGTRGIVDATVSKDKFTFGVNTEGKLTAGYKTDFDTTKIGESIKMVAQDFNVADKAAKVKESGKKVLGKLLGLFSRD